MEVFGVMLQERQLRGYAEQSKHGYTALAPEHIDDHW
jgi:hypothetical protein